MGPVVETRGWMPRQTGLVTRPIVFQGQSSARSVVYVLFTYRFWGTAGGVKLRGALSGAD